MNRMDDPPKRRYVRASDRRLAEVAAQAAARIDLKALQYQRPVSTGVTTEHSKDGTVVTVTTVIECSLAEMRSLLTSPTSDRYASLMQELVGQDFIYGAIVHHAKEITTHNVTVRTATFLKRHMLARNEQWCYVRAIKTLDPFDQNNQEQGFTVELASLDPDDVFTGKAQAASVMNIRGLSILYLVTADPGRLMKNGRTRRTVRVTFCAHVATVLGASRPSRFRWLKLSRNREDADDASSGAVLARVMQLARVPKQLQVAVRRCRLDAQVLADLRKVQPRNSRCACCTRRVSGMKDIFGPSKARVSKRCQLCGFLVCSRCVCTVGKGSLSREPSEPLKAGIKYRQDVHLCEHCMQRVDDADYDSYCTSSDTLSPWSVEPDSPNAEPVSAVIARALSRALGNASQEESRVVIRVIKHLLSPRHESEHTNFRVTSAELAKSLGHLAENQEFVKIIPKPKVKQGAGVTCAAVSPSSEASDVPPVAGASGRQYALQYADLCNVDAAEDAEDTDDTEEVEDGDDGEDGEDGEVVKNLARHPVPADDVRRLQWIDNHPNIVSSIMGLPDLMLLCSIAREELKCDAVMITIIGPNVSHVVASTNRDWQGARIPREHSICCHTIMTGAPLLVRHPEADVRFTAMDVVRLNDVRFYFGFPIRIMYPDRGHLTAVGTLCCVNAGKSGDVSESQYTVMATLVEGVARVMEHFAEELSGHC